MSWDGLIAAGTRVYTPDGYGEVLDGEQGPVFDALGRKRGYAVTHHIVKLESGERRTYKNGALKVMRDEA